VNILLHGGTGTGKEVLARALHESSNRCKNPFVAVNCSAIPESLIESELFGYVGGSFTGSRSKGMRGLIQQSDRGTLFLDEIGDMPLHLQSRLLRVLSEREILPIGGDKPIPVELTVVAASHRDLRRLIGEGKFREDLYYRLCGATLLLPPLRERTDKAYVIRRVLEQESAQMGIKAELSERVMALFLDFSWPGNIRQLRNVVRFAVAVCEDGYVGVDDLPPEFHAEGGETSVEVTNDVVTLAAQAPASPGAAQLLEVLRRHRWNITSASIELGICRATVYRQMKRLRVVSPKDL
jgi:sigma-54 dependent transcriptional regulator, acetoin dehydrogenase operon transcriptional activator AcoR